MARTTMLPLLALTLCAFSVSTSELMLVGLLPELSNSLGVSVPQAGLLVTGYAVGVIIAAPIVAVITNGVARRPMILVLMAVFAAGNLICALAPDYTVLLIARILTAVSHAAVFGSAAVMAADIVPEDRRARAVAIVFSGATFATIAGVPLGTAAGGILGWQSAFWMTTLLGAASILAILVWLPNTLPAHRADFRREMKVLAKSRQVILALVVTALVWASLFAVFTFIAPILEDVAGASEHSVVIFLFAFGVGMTIGNFIGGRLADWHLLPSIIGMIAAAAVLMAVISIIIHNAYLVIATLLVWGLFIFALAPAMQYWAVKSAHGAEHLLSTINQGSFHLGSAAGAWISASALYFGVGYRDLPWVGEGLALAALAIAVLAITGEFSRRKQLFSRLTRRQAPA
ncbi:MAG: MFS transporter [Pseudomonadota bacterium]